MSETTKPKVYKYKNIAAALAVILLILVAVSTSCSSRQSKKKAVEDKDDIAGSSVEETKPVKEDASKRLTKNYTYNEMQNGTAMYNGLLLQVDAQHPFKGQVNNTESLYSFLFDKNCEQVMAASYPSDEALPEMLQALNDMAVAFEAQSHSSGMLMITSMIPDADDTAQRADEAYIGSTVDLMVFDGESYLEFTGKDSFAWIPQNCAKYGFVMRGADRLRYVGREAAELIDHMKKTDGSADLEKFQSAVREYSFEKPWFVTTDNGTEYASYFVAAEEGTLTTSVPVPMRDDESSYPYIISGNNADGYIVIADITENKEFDSNNNSAADSKTESEAEGEYLL